MNFTVANHNNAKNPKNFINYDGIEFENIPEMVMSECAYCACRLKDNYRLDKNFDGAVDVLIIDVDENCTIEQAKILFKKYKFFLITSRSHQKDKGGLTCDRFRLFFKLERTINICEHIEQIYSNFIDTYNFIDTSCRNVSRLYFASPSNSIVYYNEGKEYPVKLIPMGVEDKVIEKETHTMPKRSGWLKRPENVLENITETDEETKLKGVKIFLDDNFHQGNKSNSIFQAGSIMKEDGFNQDETFDFLYNEWENRRGSKDRFADFKQNALGAYKYN